MSSEDEESKSMVGRTVMVEFPLKDTATKAWFRGTVKQVSTFMRADEDQTIQSMQRIVFDDGDAHWIDLEEQEAMGRVVWPAAPKPELNEEEEDSKPAASTRAASKKRATTAAAVTPELKQKKSRKQRAPVPVARSTAAEKKKEALPDWLDDMKQWLQTVPHGPQDKVCSIDITNRVMSNVRKLVQGNGVTYTHWPKNACFYKDVKVDLESCDFQRMYEEAQAFEDKYGEDKENGRVIRLPIQKLRLYQEYKLANQVAVNG